MVDRDFRHPRTRQAKKRRQKSVHSGKHREAFRKRSAIDPQGAADIGDGLVGNPVADAIGDFRRHSAHPGVVSLGADSRDHVPSLRQLLQHPRQIRGIVLQVRVEAGENRSLGVAEPGVERGRLAGVDLQVQDPAPGMLLSELPGDGEGAVGRAVIDEQYLVAETQRDQGTIDLLHQHGEIPLLVVGRDDDRELQIF